MMTAVPGRANFRPIEAQHPTDVDVSVHQPKLPEAEKIDEESEE